MLNERRAGLPESPWEVVDQSLYPDQTALDLLALDVTTPVDGQYGDDVQLGAHGALDGPRASGSRRRSTATSRSRSPRRRRRSFTLRIVDPATGGQIAVAPGTARVKTLQTSRLRPAQPAGPGAPGARLGRLHARRLEAVDHRGPPAGRRIRCPSGRAPWPSG